VVEVRKNFLYEFNEETNSYGFSHAYKVKFSDKVFKLVAEKNLEEATYMEWRNFREDKEAQNILNSLEVEKQ
jgi:hypothetical protein